MNAEQFQAIKERAKYATDGPWKVVKSEDSGVQIGTAWEHGQLKAGVPIVTTGHGKDGVTVYINHVNAEFIAHAREDIPALIAEVERLQKALKNTDADLYVYKDLYNEMTDKSIELIKFLQTRISKGWGQKAVDVAMMHIQEQEKEIERLRSALEFYADIEKYQHTIQGDTLSRIDLDAGHVAAKALAGDSDAI